MNKKLFFQAITKYIIGLIVIGCLIFIPANSLEYWNGCLLMGLLCITMLAAGIFLMIKNIELIQKILNAI